MTRGLTSNGALEFKLAMKTKANLLALAATAALLTTTAAHAHVSVASGPAVANVSQEITFGVGHGCAGADTLRVKLDIPAGVTSVRPLTSDFGRATVEKNGANVTSVTWQKADADLLATDDNYYKLTVRLKAPNAPFTKIYFPTHQTCRDAGGVETTVDWVGTPTLPDGGSTAPDGAPTLIVMPARLPGWNKYPVPVAVTDLSIFKDALVVWSGTAAYSFNPATSAQLKAEPGVTALTTIAAGSEIWVKY
jgi:periplasmic copper chaperone A